MAWIPTDEEIKSFKLLGGDKSTGNEDYYREMLPLQLEMLNDQLCQKFTSDTLPASIKLYLSKAVGFFAKDGNLKSRSMGTVSYSWDNSELPFSVTKLLKGYNKCSGGRFHAFRPV